MKNVCADGSNYCKFVSLEIVLAMGINRNRESVFRFKRFEVRNELAAMKVGTDGVLLGAVCPVNGYVNALDVGTGTGLIALMLAQRNQALSITAVEIDADAASEARMNVAASPWHDRITVVEGDFNKMLSDGLAGRYDIVVSNPPYFATTLKSPDSSRAMARHETGLSYDTLVNSASALLTPQGVMVFISPADREDDITMSIALRGLHVTRLISVYTKIGAKAPSRLIWFISTRPGTMCREAVYIGSPEYRELTSDFYL